MSTPFPSSVNVSRSERIFAVTWDNGHVSSFKFDDLRLLCDCALCRSEREKAEKKKLEPGSSRMLPVLGAVTRAEIASVENVGRYAIGVGWRDGHNSIYTYQFLFDSCTCDECERSKAVEAQADASQSIN